MVYSTTAGAGAMQRRPSQWPACVLPCKDGWAAISPLTFQHWELLCQLLRIDDILDEPWGRDPAWRQEHGNELLPRVEPWFAERTREEIYTESQAGACRPAPSTPWSSARRTRSSSRAASSWTSRSTAPP